MVKETVIVLGGAASAAQHDLKNLRGDKNYVIGINDAAIHAPVDCCVTMDRTWFEYRWEKLRALGIPVFAREEATINITDRWADLEIFKNNRHSNDMSLDPDRLNGINSGFCGLNLAYKMRPRAVRVLGMDCKKSGYWFPPYPWQTAPAPRGITSDWSYDQWMKGIEQIKQQFEKAGIAWN